MSLKREYSCDGPECDKQPVEDIGEMHGWMQLATLVDGDKYSPGDISEPPHGTFCSPECLVDWAIELEDKSVDQGDEEPLVSIQRGLYL